MGMNMRPFLCFTGLTTIILISFVSEFSLVGFTIRISIIALGYWIINYFFDKGVYKRFLENQLPDQVFNDLE